MSSQILVRKPRIEDVDSIFKIHLESLSGIDPEDYEWYYNLVKLRSKRRIIRVAVEDGKVVGFILAYKHRSTAYIDALAVHPEYRGKGLGGILLDKLEEELVLRRVRKIYLSVKNDNIPALGFYLKHGYRINGVVLTLSAKPENITAELPGNYTYRVLDASSSVVEGIKTLPSTWWSSLTEPVDKLLYKRMHSEEAIIVYKKGRIRGLIEYEPDEKVVVDYLAVSFHKPRESLQALLGVFKKELQKNNTLEVVILVDSSKNSLLEELMKYGFRVKGSEYKMIKTIRDKRF